MNIKSRPFTKLKSVAHKLKPKNQNHPIFRELLSGRCPIWVKIDPSGNGAFLYIKSKFI